MKVNGEKTRPMAEENSGMLMEIYTRENGKMIRQMDMESTYMSMVHNMRATGKMISRMVKAWNRGKMEADMKEDTRKV